MAEDESPSLPPGGFPSTFSGAGSAAAALPQPPDLDLDLDLDLPDDALTEAPPAAPGGFAAAAAAATSSRNTAPHDDEPQTLRPELDLPDLSPSASWSGLDATASPVITPPPSANLEFPSANDLSMAPSGPMPLSGDAQDSGPMEFDLGELSLDLTAPSKPIAAPVSKSAAPAPLSMDDGSAAAQDDPLSTKLALAEEFNAIGDTDGARTLIEEVVAESTGALKTRAQRMLNELG